MMDIVAAFVSNISEIHRRVDVTGQIPLYLNIVYKSGEKHTIDDKGMCDRFDVEIRFLSRLLSEVSLENVTPKIVGVR
jgi:hypothetical protein